MSSVIGAPSSEDLASTTRPYRKAPMTTALPSYTTSRDVTRRMAAIRLPTFSAGPFVGAGTSRKLFLRSVQGALPPRMWHLRRSIGSSSKN